MDYDEACKMHLTPGVVHKFPKAVGVEDSCLLCTTSQIPIRKEKGATLGIPVSLLNNRWYRKTPNLSHGLNKGYFGKWVKLGLNIVGAA